MIFGVGSSSGGIADCCFGISDAEYHSVPKAGSPASRVSTAGEARPWHSPNRPSTTLDQTASKANDLSAFGDIVETTRKWRTPKNIANVGFLLCPTLEVSACGL
jgi:hypothetical protein